MLIFEFDPSGYSTSYSDTYYSRPHLEADSNTWFLFKYKPFRTLIAFLEARRDV